MMSWETEMKFSQAEFTKTHNKMFKIDEMFLFLQEFPVHLYPTSVQPFNYLF